eukprot:CAMPEP_0196582062 /NCGR_PEP_ID=MMETSP1081-20130531/37309_1 /TAXON_ID=36882 /ORGANISM="Pyramimonas amylifera, Strain CCMP720" /LENGTH=509 /DNA_ID=CAMNT_0041902535 /DNA_START=96 /DNA_END=1622 /DNA_ORIENTATION=+
MDAGAVKQRGEVGGVKHRGRRGKRLTEIGAAAKRQTGKSRAYLLKHKSRAQLVVQYLMLFAGAAIFASTIAGAILLTISETCRWPKYEYCETFTYTIDLEYPMGMQPIYEFFNNKATRITGGQVNLINITQEYGTYTVVADNDPDLSHIRFEVCNRAQDKYWTKRTTRMEVKAVEKEKMGSKMLMHDVSLISDTSGTSGGSVQCRRADVTVYVPTTCMFEDTTLHVEVTKGNIDVFNMTTNFDTITLFNDNGVLSADQLSGVRINMNTSYGHVDASNVSAHFLFLQARASGGTVKGANLNMFSSDNASSCVTTYSYREGFPEEPVYRLEEVECEQEEGKLTTDTRGEELEIVNLNRFGGGSVEHVNKIGTTYFKLMACYDFSGFYDIREPTGLITLFQEYRVRERIVQDQLSVYRTPMIETVPPTNWYRDSVDSTSSRRRGEICRMGSGAESMPAGFVPGNSTLKAWSIQTGNITLEILEPEIFGEVDSAGLLASPGKMWLWALGVALW